MDKHYTIEEMNELWKDLGLKPSDSIPPDATFVLCDRQARQVGTGYQDYFYKMFDGDGKETGHAFVVNANRYSQFSGFFNDYTLKKDYYSQRKEYAKETSKLAKKYGVEFDTGLAFNKDEQKFAAYADALKAIQVLSSRWKEIGELKGIKNDLSCGINRRKAALKEVLGEKVYNDLGVDGMGQAHSERLARDCLKQLDTPLSKEKLIPPYFQNLLVQMEVWAKINGSKTLTVESEALNLSISPTDKEQGNFEVLLTTDDQKTLIPIASFSAVPDKFSQNGSAYIGDLIFNDETVSKIGDLLYGDKKINEVIYAIENAVIMDHFEGYTVELSGEQLGFTQDEPSLDDNPNDIPNHDVI